jgi:hypothetical protein
MSHNNVPDAVLPALTVYCTYLKHCTVNADSFSGTHLNKLIDDFAPVLVEHLSKEIPSLLSLSRFGPKLPLLNMIDRECKRSPLNLSTTGGTPFFFRNLDVEFEDGLWKTWPPMPVVVWHFMQWTFVTWHRKWWRFASCDADGRLRMLPAFKIEGQPVGKEGLLVEQESLSE